MPAVSVIIPARNEKYLDKTLNDLFVKAKGEIEAIVVLDGYWPSPIIGEDRIIYIHRGKARGMRAAINSAVAIAKGEYLMKMDAHCMFDEGFDVKLTADCQDNWVVVPRRYALDPEKWALIDNPKYPIDYMYLSKNLHGNVWDEKNRDLKLKKKLVDETMSNQGSVWFMPKSYFYELELMDEETYGTFWNEFQEIGLKCWLSGGKVMVNKKTWYAHWHKTGDVGRGYSLSHSDQPKALAAVEKWRKKGWHKQTLPLSWLIDHFKPVPTWTP
jgi:glycosyltransferase involved in cell wall biosynthesis